MQQDKTFADAVAFLEVCFKERVKEGERTGSNRNEGSLHPFGEAMQCAEALENLIESDAWSGTDHLLCRLNWRSWRTLRDLPTVLGKPFPRLMS